MLGPTQRCTMTKVDHLIVMVSSLDEGVAWCEATLGITPGPGGEHAFMGTHNRLFKVASEAFPQAYFEIIAINTKANNADRTCRNRWFDMDSSALQAKIERTGPQLIHWVASVPQLPPMLVALKSLDIERGNAVQASRNTPNGLLQWQISIREDGHRLFDGCLPTLIEWGTVHPSDNMPDIGVVLKGIHMKHPEAPKLENALREISLPVSVESGIACFSVDLQTPKGQIRLSTS